MTDKRYSTPLFGKRNTPEANLSVGVVIAAAALALLIGLSTAGSQSKRTTGTDQSRIEQIVDGRGKWRGDM